MASRSSQPRSGGGVGREGAESRRGSERQEMYVPEVLATQARSCAAMAAG